MNNYKRLNLLWKKAEKINCIDEFLCRIYGVLEAYSGAITEEIINGIERAFDHTEKYFNLQNKKGGKNE